MTAIDFCNMAMRGESLPHNWERRCSKREVRMVFNHKFSHLMNLIRSGKKLPHSWDKGLNDDQKKCVFDCRGFGTLTNKSDSQIKVAKVIGLAKFGKGKFKGEKFANGEYRYFEANGKRIDFLDNPELRDVIVGIRKDLYKKRRCSRVERKVIESINKSNSSTQSNIRQLRALGLIVA